MKDTQPVLPNVCWNEVTMDVVYELTPIYKLKFIQFPYIIFTAVTVRELKMLY
jgi:hypothetical protein